MIVADIDIVKIFLKPLFDALLSSGMLRILIPFLAMMAVAALLRLPIVKGWLGELMVNWALQLRLNKTRYHLIRNVTLFCGDKTTQIDHVIVSRFGIFVIETKNMRGWIFGSASDEIWTQKFRRRSFKFQNPLRQNFKHVAALCETLGCPMDVFRPIIMFIGDAKLKTTMPENVLDRRLVSYIKSHHDIVLSDEDITKVLNTIAQKRLAPGLQTHVKHVRNVQEIIAEKRTRQAAAPKPLEATGISASSVTQSAAPAPVQPVPVCPKCGSMMVSRVARSGSRIGKVFWGCSRYPQCKAIVNRD